jgi:hypothetical protein
MTTEEIDKLAKEKAKKRFDIMQGMELCMMTGSFYNQGERSGYERGFVEGFKMALESSGEAVKSLDLSNDLKDH